MKALALLILVALPLAFCANLRSRQYYEYAFETFRRHYNKEYASADEHMYRIQVFADNLDKIESHNAGKHSYTLGVNKFADMTLEEFKNAKFCGCYGGIPGAKRVAPNRVHQLRNHDVDWTKEGAVTPVKDQGMCGSCWAFSATGSLESVNYIKNGKLIGLSEQQLVDCSTEYGNFGCNGGLMDSAFDYVKDHGICSEEDYAYKGVDGQCKTTCKPVFKISSYVSVEKKESALEEAVTLNPVSVGINADPLMFYQSGIYDGECSEQLDHGVLTVGYGVADGKKYWKVKNSWGASWGEKGYFRFAKDIGGHGMCGIVADASYPVA